MHSIQRGIALDLLLLAAGSRGDIKRADFEQAEANAARSLLIPTGNSSSLLDGTADSVSVVCTFCRIELRALASNSCDLPRKTSPISALHPIARA